jgi:hypothetical protein
MWAPADVFSHALSIFLAPLKVLTTYLYEHPVVLTAVVLGAAVLIAASTVLAGRRGPRT